MNILCPIPIWLLWVNDIPDDISNGDVISTYLGLLCQGKSDFDAIEPFRQDDFFRFRWISIRQPRVQPYGSAWIWQGLVAIGKRF